MIRSVLQVVRGLVKLAGNTDNTLIGNTGDRLKVTIEDDHDITGAYPTLPVEHHKLHEGHRYSFDAIFTLANGVDRYYGITTPNSNIYAHFTTEISATGPTEIRLFESSTFSGGTSQTYYNRERNSSNTGNLTVVLSPTVTTDGTELEVHRVGDVGVLTGGFASSIAEWVLKKNTKYLVKVTSLQPSNNIDLAVNWYEDGADL